MARTRKYISRDTFIPEGEFRTIIGLETTENGQAAWRLAGPKGGSFRLVLPEWFAIQAEGQVEVGDEISNGGWQAGRFVIPEFYEGGDED